jgi:hypothetical protein
MAIAKPGLKEVRDLGGFPGIVLETVPTPEEGTTLTYVAMIPYMKMGEIANPYFVDDFSYDRSSRTARVLPKGPSGWLTLPLSIIESRSKHAAPPRA